MRCATSTILVVFILAAYAHAAPGPRIPTGDRKAVALATRSLVVLTKGALISDVTLTGDVTWNGNDSGPATFKALGIDESRVDLSLSAGTYTEIRDSQTGKPSGQWSSNSQVAKAMPSQNCQTDPVWFFPALSSLGGRQNRVLKYIGQETRNDVTVEHIRSYASNPKLPTEVASRVEALTAVDFYLDANTLIPVAMSFNIHPDNDNNTDLLTEVEFSDYQDNNGVQVPMRIRKYIQGKLLLDFTVSNVVLNGGLGNVQFVLTAAQGGR